MCSNLIRRNKISMVSMYAGIGSPWRAPLSKLKYWVVVPSMRVDLLTKFISM